jgi:hypothetical protein
VIQLKGAATLRLVTDGLHPFLSDRKPDGSYPKCFARREWKVFLDSADDVTRAVRYVEENPRKEGLPRQYWRLITPYV